MRQLAENLTASVEEVATMDWNFVLYKTVPPARRCMIPVTDFLWVVSDA